MFFYQKVVKIVFCLKVAILSDYFATPYPVESSISLLWRYLSGRPSDDAQKEGLIDVWDNIVEVTLFGVLCAKCGLLCLVSKHFLEVFS